MPLKGSLTFETGLTLNNAYLVITEIRKKYPDDSKMCDIFIEIYKDKSSCMDKKLPIVNRQIKVTDVSFNTYFSEAVLSAVDKTILTQSYEYLLILNEYSKMTKVS
jgi:hypothetical protein